MSCFHHLYFYQFKFVQNSMPLLAMHKLQHNYCDLLTSGVCMQALTGLHVAVKDAVCRITHPPPPLTTRPGDELR